MFRWDFVVLSLGVAAIVAAQDAGTGQTGDAPASAGLLRVELLRLVVDGANEDLAGALANSDDLSTMLHRLEQSGKVKEHERVSLSVIENVKGEAQFGRRVPVVVSESTTGTGQRVQHSDMVNVGTLLSVIARLEGDQVVVQLKYEASNCEPEEGSVGPPPIKTMTAQSTLKTKLDEPMLVSGARADEQAMLIMTVTRPSRGQRAATRRERASSVPAQRDAEPRQSASSEGVRVDRLEAFARGFIQRYDKNGNGRVERDEAVELRSFLGQFDDYDADGDGHLTLEEVRERMKQRAVGQD
jgi:hypothetical protein